MMTSLTKPMSFSSDSLVCRHSRFKVVGDGTLHDMHQIVAVVYLDTYGDPEAQFLGFPEFEEVNERLSTY